MGDKKAYTPPKTINIGDVFGYEVRIKKYDDALNPDTLLWGKQQIELSDFMPRPLKRKLPDNPDKTKPDDWKPFIEEAVRQNKLRDKEHTVLGSANATIAERIAASVMFAYSGADSVTINWRRSGNTLLTFGDQHSMKLFLTRFVKDQAVDSGYDFDLGYYILLPAEGDYHRAIRRAD
jgi:hypothetical protein